MPLSLPRHAPVRSNFFGSNFSGRVVHGAATATVGAGVGVGGWVAAATGVAGTVAGLAPASVGDAELAPHAARMKQSTPRTVSRCCRAMVAPPLVAARRRDGRRATDPFATSSSDARVQYPGVRRCGLRMQGYATAVAPASRTRQARRRRSTARDRSAVVSTRDRDGSMQPAGPILIRIVSE